MNAFSVLYQINDSAVVGVNPSVKAQVKQQGGLLKQSIMGDSLRVPINKTQVLLVIIVSSCNSYFSIVRIQYLYTCIAQGNQDIGLQNNKFWARGRVSAYSFLKKIIVIIITSQSYESHQNCMLGFFRIWFWIK